MKKFSLILSLSLAVTLLLPTSAEIPKIKIDTLARITEVKYSETEKVNYTYDPSGNILSVRITTARGTFTQVDTDGDKIPDAWEVEFFASKGVVDATTDFDGDGSPDLMEYATGHHPLLPKSHSSPVFYSNGTENDGRQFVRVRYQKRKDTKLNLHLESTSTFKPEDWTDSSNTIVQEGQPIDNGDGTETIQCKCYLDSEVNEEGKVFVRLKVE